MDSNQLPEALEAAKARYQQTIAALAVAEQDHIAAVAALKAAEEAIADSNTHVHEA
ncbi:MAG: hypothetical protein HYU78_00530 [Rhodocyclales bacterium]|nr:hypothetical protein [Rhodocyclales bacterium]